MTDIQDPCPKWCVTLPGDDGAGHTHRTSTTSIELPGGGLVNTRGGIFGSPEIVVHAFAPARERMSGDLYVPASDAGQLAAVVEVLAHATPDQHRHLAAGIRQAGAEMTATEAEPGAGA